MASTTPVAGDNLRSKSSAAQPRDLGVEFLGVMPATSSAIRTHQPGDCGQNARSQHPSPCTSMHALCRRLPLLRCHRPRRTFFLTVNRTPTIRSSSLYNKPFCFKTNGPARRSTYEVFFYEKTDSIFELLALFHARVKLNSVDRCPDEKVDQRAIDHFREGLPMTVFSSWQQVLSSGGLKV